ncbi:ANTAR domain-containing protein [Streptomyces sp. NPDC007264]|uniref:ANTAR domain-containing protein n=1 Tax=Streptomyces sp. NPDC007264 TaxID=3364777 RepID=UPI0036DF508C
MSESRSQEQGEDSEVERLRAEVRQLRARMRTHPLISEAQGLLRERYGLLDAESAFALLQRASQQYNVKIRTLATALTVLPRPDAREPLWFPRRVRRTPPRLTFDRAGRVGHGDRNALLGTVLSQTLAVVDADMGNVQTADRAQGGLRMEKHTGHSPEFVDYFAHVGEEGTSCALAARNLAQVTVQDVETHPVFAEQAREVILREGSLACHSVPLTTASGVCAGMVSAHLDRRLPGLTEAQTKVLDIIGGEAGAWLAWYDRTVVLDALEHLHALGRAHTGRQSRRS